MALLCILGALLLAGCQAIHLHRAGAASSPLTNAWIPEPSADLSVNVVANSPYGALVEWVVLSPDGRFGLAGSRIHSDVLLWEVATGRQLRRLPTPNGAFWGGFSSDNIKAFVAGPKEVKLWDLASGTELGSQTSGQGFFSAFAIFRGDPEVAVFAVRGVPGDEGSSIQVWNLSQAEAAPRYIPVPEAIGSVSCFKEAPSCVILDDVGAVKVLDPRRLVAARPFGAEEGGYRSVAVNSATGEILLGRDGAIEIWTQEGEPVRRLSGHRAGPAALAISPDGSRLISSLPGESTFLWDLPTGTLLSRFESGARFLGRDIFTPDGSQAYVCSEFQKLGALLLNLEDGSYQPAPILTRAARSGVIAFSPSEDQLLTGGRGSEALLWDLRQGQPSHSPFPGVSWANFSSTGDVGLTRDFNGNLQIRDPSGAPQGPPIPTDPSANVLAVAADGSALVLGGGRSTTQLMELPSGRVVADLGPPPRGALDAAMGTTISATFAPDGRHVAISDLDGTRILEVRSGLQTHKIRTPGFLFEPSGAHVLLVLPEHLALRADLASSPDPVGGGWPIFLPGVAHLLYSPDGHALLGWGPLRGALLLDPLSGNPLREFRVPSGQVDRAFFSPSGRWVVVTTDDGASHIFETATSLRLGTLYAFSDGSWAVTDPDGRFDASNGGDIEQLHFVYGLESISLSQLKARYYDPGLLAKILGNSREPRRRVSAFTAPDLPPAMDADLRSEGETRRLEIQLGDRRGGFGPVDVYVNGRVVATLDPLTDGAPMGDDPALRSLSLDLSPWQSLILPEVALTEETPANLVTVVAYNGEGYLSSRPLDLVHPPARARSRGTVVDDPQAEEEPLLVPDLWLVAVGTSDYAGVDLDLGFPADDAAGLANALTVAGDRLLGEGKVHTFLLTTDSTRPEERPSRQVILSTLSGIAEQAQATDILVVFMAGHGESYGGTDGDYYYLTPEVASFDMTDSAVRDEVALAGSRLTQAMAEVPALKQVLILDTCKAGAILGDFSSARSVSSSQVRALDRMKDRAGLFILSGAAGDKSSYEASELAQGLLTYSLIAGIQGEALAEDRTVDVAQLFQFAADKVPELAADIGSSQRPVVATPRGGASFALGQVLPEDAQAIPLHEPLPRFIRSDFHDAAAWSDVLGLEAAVNEALRVVADRDPRPAVFAEADQLPGSLRLVGRYEEAGGAVQVSVRLVIDAEVLTTYTVSGDPHQLESLATRIVDRALEFLEE